MKEIKIQEEVIKRIDAKGWKTASDFYWSLAAGAEEAFKIILEAAKVDKGGLPTVLQTIDAGKLRRLLDECKKVCVSDKGSGKAAQSNDATAPAGRSNLLGIDLGPRLTADVLQRLWTEFEDNYPAEVVTGDLRPCRPLLQTIFSQKAQKEIRFIPWKNIMSEAQADRAKTFSSRKEKAFIDILAAAAGQADVPRNGTNAVAIRGTKDPHLALYFMGSGWLVPSRGCETVSREIHGALHGAWPGGLEYEGPVHCGGGSSGWGNLP